MATITEFSWIALKKIHEQLKAIAEDVENRSEAIKAALQIDDVKLQHTTHALQVVGSEWDNLKRVVVLTLENPKDVLPKNTVKIEDHYYLVEYFPSLKKPVAAKASTPQTKDLKKQPKKKTALASQHNRKPRTHTPSPSADGNQGYGARIIIKAPKPTQAPPSETEKTTQET